MNQSIVDGRTVIAAVVALTLITIGAIVVLDTPGSDARIGIIIALVGPTIVGLMALLRAESTGKKVDKVEEQVNGPLTELMEHSRGVLFTRRGDGVEVRSIKDEDK